MPVICKIQLDTTDYKRELDNILKLTEKVQAEVSAKSENAAQKVGADAENAAQAVKAGAESTAQAVGAATEAASQNAADLAGKIADTADAVAANASEAGEAARTSAEESAEAIREGVDAIARQTARAQADISAGAEKTAESIGTAAENAAQKVESAAERATQAAQNAAQAVEGMNSPDTESISDPRDALKNAVKGMLKEASSSPASGFVEKLKNSFSGLKNSIAESGTALKSAMGKSLGFASEIAVIAAGIASIIKIVKTLAIDLPMQKLQDRAKDAVAGFGSLKAASAQAEEYRRKTDSAAHSLGEFTSREKLSSLEKEKAVRLIKEMSQGYGKLGVSIDEATGKVVGYTSAMVKKLQKDRERRLQENTSQQASARSAIDHYDRIIDESFVWQEEQINAAQAEKMKLQKELDDLVRQRGEILRSDEAGDYLAERGSEIAGKEKAVADNEKTFAQSREFAGLSREERADALRKRIAEVQSDIDYQGEVVKASEHEAAQNATTPDGQIRIQNAAKRAVDAREKILQARQQLADYQKQLDELDEEDRRRRDEAGDAYAAGLSPAERAEMLRGRLAAAQEEQSGQKSELARLENKRADYDYIGEGDADRKLALREKIVQSDERILAIEKQIAEAETEAVRLDTEAQAQVNSYLDGKAEDLELARLEAAAEYEKADALRMGIELREKGLSLSEQELETAKKTAKELNSVSLKSNLSDQTRDLLDAAKRAAGLDKEADTDKAIREAEKAKRGKLDDDERAYVLKLVDLTRAVSGQEENPLAWKPELSSKTNELTARGGFSTGAVMPSAEQINKSILSEIQNKFKLLGDIKDLLQEGLQT